MRTSKKRTRLAWAAAVAFSVIGAGYALAPEPAQAQMITTGETPEYHVVRPGDTLWDLSGSYYRDWYQWPRMWGFNPHITNPHWIYPGDIIYLREPGERAARPPGTVATETNGAFGMHLQTGGIITTEELEYVGRIIASPKEAVMLAEHDTVWVGFGDRAYAKEDKTKDADRKEIKGQEVNPGDTFAILRELEKVQDADGNDVGTRYLLLGSLRVTETSEQYHDTAIITKSWQEIVRGDLLVPYERQIKSVNLVQADRDLVAHIIASFDGRRELGQSYYAFIDRGAEDGVRVGNRFWIYQRFEGLQFDREADEEIPWQRVGEVMVLDAREKHSTVVIIKSRREIHIGDRLEMYEGR